MITSRLVLGLGLIAACGLVAAGAQTSPRINPISGAPAAPPPAAANPSSTNPNRNADLDARLRDAGNFIRALQGNRQAAIPLWALERARAIIIFAPGSGASPGQAVALSRGPEGRFGAPVFYGATGRGPGAGAVASARGGAPVVVLLMSGRALDILANDRRAAAPDDLRVVANVRTPNAEPRHQLVDIVFYQSSPEIDLGVTMAALNTLPDAAANNRYYNAGAAVTPAEVSARTTGLSAPAERLMAIVNLSAATAEGNEDNLTYFQPPREYYQAPSAYFRQPSEYFQQPTEYFQNK